MKLWHEKQRQRLLKERARLQETLERLEETGLGEGLRESTAELSTYDNHPADLGAETFEREKDLGLRDNLRHLLDDIDDALTMMEEGRYGVCLVCGCSIPRERLEAIPAATRCAACQEKAEILDQDSRPVEEEILSPPFARSFRDDTENNAFDGEDAWQAVARFGTANTPQDELDAISMDDAYTNADEDIGLVQEVDGLIDLTQGEEEQQALIYPEPVAAQRRRRHRQSMRFLREGKGGEGGPPAERKNTKSPTLQE